MVQSGPVCKRKDQVPKILQIDQEEPSSYNFFISKTFLRES